MRGLSWLFLVHLLVAGNCVAARAQSTADLGMLNAQIESLIKAEKFSEALPLAEQVVKLTEAKQASGQAPEALAVAAALLRLAEALSGLDRFDEAEPLERRAVAIRETHLGAGHADTVKAIIAQAGSLKEIERLADAEKLYLRSLAAREVISGVEDLVIADVLENLATNVYLSQNRRDELEATAKRALAIREKLQGPEHADLTRTLQQLLFVYVTTARHADANAVLSRLIPIQERGPDQTQLAVTLGVQASLASTLSGRPAAEVEEIHKRIVAIREKVQGPQHADTGGALSSLAQFYSSVGRFEVAEELARRGLAIRENALPPDHPAIAESINALTSVLEWLDRRPEAAPLIARSIAIREKTLGPDHPDMITARAKLLESQGRFEEAGPLFERAVGVREKALGPDHFSTAEARRVLAEFYVLAGRYQLAEPILQRHLAFQTKTLGSVNNQVAAAHRGLAKLYLMQARYGEAENHLKQNVAIQEALAGAQNAEVGTALLQLAVAYLKQRRDAETEATAKRALGIVEASMGADSSATVPMLTLLATVYLHQERASEAEPLLKRALAIIEATAAGPIASATILNNLANAYRLLGRLTEAEPFYLRALAMTEATFGPEHAFLVAPLNNLSELYGELKQPRKAEPFARRALAIAEKGLGPDHPDLALLLNNLAGTRREQGLFDDADLLYQRSISIYERSLGLQHPDAIAAQDNLATNTFERGQLSGALDLWRRSTAAILARDRRGGYADTTSSNLKTEAAANSNQFFHAVKSAWLLAEAEPKLRQSLAAEMFQAAQWSQSSQAAQSLAQMAARGARRDPQLARLVREHQDLVAEWRQRDALRVKAASLPAAQRNRAGDADTAMQLKAISARLTELDQLFKTSFPEFFAMSRPEAVTIADVQASIGSGEAVVLFLDMPAWKSTPEETFIWVVTRSAARWVRSEAGSSTLRRLVETLRCGLDVTSWAGHDGRDRCLEHLVLGPHQVPASIGDLPFDASTAHVLYDALFNEVQDLIRGKDLLLVPSGPLTRLPFQALVTQEPTPGASLREIAWFARSHATTVLPAVSSLVALRRIAKPSAATKPMIGFGNPLLNGSDPRLAARARAFQKCPEQRPLPRQDATVARTDHGLLPSRATRGGLADVDRLRQVAPLPETADELCAVAHDLGVAIDDILLGVHATEAHVKKLSATGTLADYRIVHFATHGALAGQLGGTTEPGLILTPPVEATEDDDGYLSAAEIAGLKLDADWAILSACNTAGAASAVDGVESGEALSGIARAFFYAQARALLVSHWEVETNATVALVINAVGAVTRDRTVGRAEALRRAMLTMIDKGRTWEAHPAYWAPFVVVGEGAAR